MKKIQLLDDGNFAGYLLRGCKSFIESYYDQGYCFLVNFKAPDDADNSIVDGLVLVIQEDVARALEANLIDFDLAPNTFYHMNEVYTVLEDM